ncbi:MAG: LacI family DNA-binding transcriptional regulator [Anaerolineae bacterium]
MPTTLKDIARRSGFSVTTVSRALGGFSDVSESTRAQILQIAEELGYEPNQIARQLQRKRTNTIGLVMPARWHTLDDDFFSLLLKGITYAAARYQYDVLISATNPEASEMHAYRRMVGGNRVDGMILARTYRKDARIEYLQAAKHPFIVHGRSAPGETSDFPYIDVDSQSGLKLLVTHLISIGYNRIGLILPPLQLAFTDYRLAGYRAALTEAGIPFDSAFVTNSDLSYAGGLQSTRELLTRNVGLNAIVGCNDWMALGAMTAAQEAGLTVGKDFAIAGYDDIPAAARATPPLTTVRQPIYEVGELLTQRLIQLINGDSTVQYHELIQPELVVRESSLPLTASGI